MIGKQKIGKTFTPLLNYLFSKEGASLIGGNMVGENVQELAAEFLFSKQLNPRVQKPVYHATLSVPCGEYSLSQVDEVQYDQRELAGKYKITKISSL